MQHIEFRDYDHRDRDLIDAREAARLTGLHTRTLYRWVRERRLRRFRVLGSALPQFERADLLACLEE
jgi:excisionase family DNA binding protein